MVPRVSGLSTDDRCEVQYFVRLFIGSEPGLVPRQEFWILRWGLTGEDEEEAQEKLWPPYALSSSLRGKPGARGHGKKEPTEWEEA